MSNHLCLPFVNGQPNVEKLQSFLPHVGFRPLSIATPADFPAGAIVVLYNIKTFSFDTVIVNSLGNNIFFYARQCSRYSNTWVNTFSRDSLYEDYLFKVIS